MVPLISAAGMVEEIAFDEVGAGGLASLAERAAWEQTAWATAI